MRAAKRRFQNARKRQPQKRCDGRIIGICPRQHHRLRHQRQKCQDCLADRCFFDGKIQNCHIDIEISQPENQDEQAALTSYLNQNAGYRHGEHLWSTDLNKTTMTGYVGSALVLKAGGLLHIPFGILYKLGRLGNLYVFVAVLLRSVLQRCSPCR